MPAKPRPKAAEMANRPASSWVNENAVMTTAWQAEPAITVRRPPKRSASAPHAWRARKADASMIDSMVALRVGEMPISVQKATRCACGTDIGMQQQKPATQSSACTRLGCMPPMRLPAAVTCGRCCGTRGSGVGFNNRVAGRIATSV